MSTFVTGRRNPARSFGPDAFADITDGGYALAADGIDFDADLTPAQQQAIRDRMTSRDDADQTARANIATLNDCLTAATLPPELEPLRALVTALADYTLGGLMDGIPLTVLGYGSGWALVAWFVLLVYRGNLVARRAVDDMLTGHARERESIEHDRDEWRAAHRISETARVEEREHNAALLADIAVPLKGFLEGFRQAAARGGAES